MVNGNRNNNLNRQQETAQKQEFKKAELFSIDGKEYDIQFMFNPNEIAINRKADVTENRGARSQQEGIPKVSFAHPNATIIKLNNLIIDVYESEKKDLGEKLKKLTQAVKFVKGKNRPPIFIFVWGQVNYLRCYVESVDYQLTLFLPDGTPVRAKVSITLKEVDPSFGQTNPPPNADLETRNRISRWNQTEITDYL